MRNLKHLFIGILALCSFVMNGQSAALNVALKFQIGNPGSTGTNPTFTMSGFVSDDLGRWDATSVQVGDSLYAINGSDLAVCAVTTINSAAGNSLNITVTCSDPLVGGIDAGQAALIHPTSEYKFPTYISGLRDDLRSMIMNRLTQRIDEGVRNAQEVAFTSGSTPPANTVATIQGYRLAKNNGGDGDLYKWNGTSWVLVGGSSTTFNDTPTIDFSGTSTVTADVKPNSLDSSFIKDKTIRLLELNQSGATTGQVPVWDGAKWGSGTVSGGVDSTFVKTNGTYTGKIPTSTIYRTGKTAFGKNLNLGQTSFYGSGSGINDPVISLSVDTTQNYHMWLKLEQTRQNPYAYTPFGLVSSYDGVQPGGYKDYVWSLGPNAAGNSGASFDATKPMASINWETSWNEGGIPTYEWHEHWKQPDSTAIRLKSYTIRYKNGTNMSAQKNIDLYHTADQFSVKSGNNSKSNPVYFSTSCGSYATGEKANISLRLSNSGRFFWVDENGPTCAIYTNGGAAGTNFLNFGANDGVMFAGSDRYTKSTRLMECQNFTATGATSTGTLTVLTGSIDMVSGQRLLRTNPSQTSLYFGNSAGPNTALTTNSFDVGIGFSALGNVQNGSLQNASFGSFSGRYQTLPKNNVFLGTYVAGNTNVNMQKCVLIGDSCSINTSGNNRLWIENSGSTTPLFSGNFSTDKVGINVPNGTLRTTLDIRGTDAITIPSGTTAQRITGAIGDMRVNTTTGNFEGVRVGTTYENFLMSGSVSALMREESFTATAAQTAFTIAYTAPAVSGTNVPIRVYRNGVRLFYVASGPTSTQFTYTGTSVTTSANTAGDIITVEYLN